MKQSDCDKIIQDTFNVFNQTVIQTEKYQNLPKVGLELYQLLHPEFLNPTKIKIDCDLFLEEIKQYDSYFEQWGKLHTHLPRYGLALVNQNGLLNKNDVINGSLYQYNESNPNNPIFETDCIDPTEVMNLSSLQPLKVLSGYWTRSNIFKWEDTAKFMPHIDAFLPTPWLRLWGTTDPDSVEVNYFQDTFKTCENVERGRIYLIDTSLVHDAKCLGNTNYQFFLSINARAAANLWKTLTK